MRVLRTKEMLLDEIWQEMQRARCDGIAETCRMERPWHAEAIKTKEVEKPTLVGTPVQQPRGAETLDLRSCLKLPSSSSSIQEQSVDSAEEDETDDEGWQIKMTRGPAVVGVLGCEGAADGASHQDPAEEMQRRTEGNAASVVQPGMPEEANFAAPLRREDNILQAAELQVGCEPVLRQD